MIAWGSFGDLRMYRNVRLNKFAPQKRKRDCAWCGDERSSLTIERAASRSLLSALSREAPHDGAPWRSD